LSLADAVTLPPSAQRSSLMIALIAMAAFALNVAYGLAVPPWMGPDEPRHVEYVLLLVEKGRLVAWGDSLPEIEERITRSMDSYNFWRYGLVSPDVYRPGSRPTSFDQIWSPGLTHELHQPPLYYLMQAPLALLSRGMDIAGQVRLMRLLSALLAAGTVVMTWLAAREAFPGDRLLVITAAAFVAFLPMHAFMAGVVNNDALAELLGAVLVYTLVRGLRRGFSPGMMLASLLFVVLGLLTKRTTAVAPVLLGWAIFLVLRRQRRVPLWRIAGVTIAGLGAIAWLASRFVDVLDRVSTQLPAVLHSLVYIYILFLVRPGSEHRLALQLDQFTTADAFAYYRRWLNMLFETFWARFGWVNIRIHWLLYDLLAILTMVALAGAVLIVWEAVRGQRPPTAWQRDVIVFLAGAIVLAFLLLVVKTVREWDAAHIATTQARFLFPALAPIAILFVGGLRRLVSGQWHGLMSAGLVAGLLVLNAICLLHYIIPFYQA